MHNGSDQVEARKPTLRSMILGKRGVRPEMEFVCCDCQSAITGEEILDGTYLYIVRKNTDDPIKSVWRCENCQDDWLEQQQDCCH